MVCCSKIVAYHVAAVEEALEKGPYVEIFEWRAMREKHLVSLAFRAQEFEKLDGLSKAMMGIGETRKANKFHSCNSQLKLTSPQVKSNTDAYMFAQPSRTRDSASTWQQNAGHDLSRHLAWSKAVRTS